MFVVNTVVNTGPIQIAPTQPIAVIARKIKHKHFQKESIFPLPLISSVTSPHGDPPPELIRPLATRAEAWQAIPGVSDWVLGIIKRGYSFQFARRPPRFSGVVPTLVQSTDTHVLRSEVMNLLAKRAVETVPPAQSESGFYNHYFLILKKDGGLRPILDLRHLNRVLMRQPFRMITLKQILSQVYPGDWLFLLDMKDTYFHIQIAPHHRRFLRFAFEGVTYQYTVLPFGLSLAPHAFTKCMDAALSPLRQMGRLNRGADMLSRSNVSSEEWMLHPQTVQRIWEKDRDASGCDRILLYAFPPMALIAQVIRWIREQIHKVLLVAPLWRNQHWFAELSRLLSAATWPIPLRRNLLSLVNRTIWHPQPELWALHLWPLDGSLQTSPRAYWAQSLRLERRLRDDYMPLNGLSSPPGVQPVAQTQFPATYLWYCPSCKSCWIRVVPLPPSRSM